LNEDCRLNISMMSDTHLEMTDIFRQVFLIKGLKNISKAQSPVDAVLIDGDLTNYADEDSLARYYNIIKKYSVPPVISVAGNHDIGHAGDRNVTDISRAQAKENFIRYNNEYRGTPGNDVYYSLEINGYKFIVLGDESIDGGHFDTISMSEQQLQFLDSELAAGTKEGKPVFVCCHWPIEGINGEDVVWPGSGIEKWRYDIHSILKEYDNVFYISGHMHTGIKATLVDKLFGLSNAEQVDGVTYLNLPTYGIINMFGLFWSGTGAQLEVYDDEVVFRPICYLTQNWYENSVYHFEII
ncbi:MAG: metallophosphoesterase, partial [Clostridia bacterium]|nr:metallophosphoesterase [Clostridia bacterium]